MATLSSERLTIMIPWIELTSSQNEQVKKWKKLHTRKGRLQMGALLIEGAHLITEAIHSHIPFYSLLVDVNKRELAMKMLDGHSIPANCYALPTPLFASIVATESPQGMAAVVEMPSTSWTQLMSGSVGEAVYLLLDAMQDPGNLGTMMRTAEAAGVTGLCLGTGTVDPFQAKVVRAAAGSIFRLPFVQGDLREMMAQLQQSNLTIIGTSPRAGMTYFQYRFPERSAILLGNEGRGIDPALQRQIDVEVMIPMLGCTESLNVSTTGAILLYERVRQRWGSQTHNSHKRPNCQIDQNGI
jgi:RNA methyltransferase, TrmH family